MDDFYKIMGEFYSGDMKRHSSPTKRLIAQKQAAWNHKAVLNPHREANKYGLHYNCSPRKSYVIEPEGGELNYDLARNKPLKFYD